MSNAARVILVVGASSGIGRASAHLLAAAGDHLVLAARGTNALAEAAAECRARGAASVSVRTLDVRDAAAVSEVFDGVLREHGRLDAVVHAAGVVAYGNLVDLPLDIVDGVLDTNLRGAIHVARCALTTFRQNEAGTLILVGSILGDIAAPGMTAYAVSKHALASLGRQLALENRDLPRVRVCVVSPGSVDTPIYRQAANYSGRAGRPPAPVGRPETVARAIVGALDSPRDRISVGLANPVMRAGFRLLPGVFDAIVGPAFRLIATRPGAQPPTDGNVLKPVEELDAVHGGENQGLSDVFARLRGR